MNFYPKPRRRLRNNLFEAIARGESFEPYLDPEPTSALPGSLEKIAVLRRRLTAGKNLHVTGDRTISPITSWRQIAEAMQEVMDAPESLPNSVPEEFQSEDE